MVYEGPQKYPGANIAAAWYQDNYGGTRMESNVVVWHTTEGRTLPSYGGGASAPNLTVVPMISRKVLKWYQHFDIDRSSRALVNLSGGAETNTGNAVQVELVGTCDPATRDKWTRAGYRPNVDFIFWPSAPDWALAELAKFVTWLHEEHDVKIESKVTWKAYPGSYGATPTRLTNSEWNSYYGHLGHQHVPENTHGDPGDLDFKRIIELALGEDMALDADDIRKIFNTDDIVRSPDDTTNDNKFWTLASYLRETYLRAREAKAEVTDVGRQVARVEAKVDGISVGGVDLDALAVKVADELYRRMQS